VNPYEVLGVTSSATPDDVRRAYLTLARRYHPDAGTGDAEAMVEINAAWALLSDPAERALLDDDQRRSERSFVKPPGAEHFVPYDYGDDEGEDDWRYEPDVGDPRTAPTRSVLMAPVVCVVGLVACFAGWAVTGHPILIAGMVIFAALAVVGFLVAPLVAMSKASRFERRP
jgi:hypothetical protein